MDIYKNKVQSETKPISEQINTSIKKGDLIVAIYGEREIRGEVSGVYEKNGSIFYQLKGKNGVLNVMLDNITEHYPKNRTFENKNPVPVNSTSFQKFSKINETVDVPKEHVEKPEPKKNDKVQQKRRRIVDDIKREEMERNPDNQVSAPITENFSLDEKVKKFGKVIYYTDVKFSDVTQYMEKKLLSKEEYWYLITEKQNEIHIVRNNDQGLKIQPFACSFVEHHLKVQKLNESFSQIKVKGNDSFSIISNIPEKIQRPILNTLIGILSK